MPKSTSQAEATSNSEKIKPIALAVIELCLTEKKFQGKFLKAFQVNLNACLDLVLANQYYPIVVWGVEAGFQVILLCGPCLLLGCPYYEPLLWFMIQFNNFCCSVVNSKLKTINKIC